MLNTLTIWNFALLEHVQIDFDRGLNILTGETGAGKSIMIDAIGAILGNRVSPDVIRTGCDWAKVEAVFGIENQPAVHDFLADHAINDEEDILIITRKVSRTGRGALLINGSHATKAVLRTLGDLLVDIHGQNENLALLRTESQFALLDGFDDELESQLSAYRSCYGVLTDLENKLANREKASQDYAQRLDMLKWQVQEIEQAQLTEGEDDELEKEISRLANGERIARCVGNACNLLYGGGKTSQGAISLLEDAVEELKTLERYDESLSAVTEAIHSATVQVKESGYDVRDYADSMDFDPHRLDQLQSRMDVIDKLRRKYGATIADVLKYYDKAQQELNDIENFDEDVEALKAEIAGARERAEAAAGKLTEIRKNAARSLSGDICGHLLALGMPAARFQIEVQPTDHLTANGADSIAMLFSANPGEDLKPIQKVASGGELSRIALAIKTVTAFRDDSPASMIFDEIDTGIGGKTAQMVAERIAMVAAGKQVLCITHLPQIACMADVHLYISKHIVNEKTTTTVQRLSSGEQVNEIARMASGAEASAASQDNAREMLSHAATKKKQIQENKG